MTDTREDYVTTTPPVLYWHCRKCHNVIGEVKKGWVVLRIEVISLGPYGANVMCPTCGKPNTWWFTPVSDAKT